MNIESVKSIFRLFSGDEDIGKYTPLISLAAAEVRGMLKEGADSSDTRLDFLCAAAANYRLQQINSAHDRSESTCAGMAKHASDSGAELKFAAKLLTDYLGMCRDLITEAPIAFAAFGTDGEVNGDA